MEEFLNAEELDSSHGKKFPHHTGHAVEIDNGVFTWENRYPIKTFLMAKNLTTLISPGS